MAMRFSRSFCTHFNIRKFNFKLPISCNVDCEFRSEPCEITSDVCCVKENREIGIQMKETPAVGIEMKCACKRYRFGKRLPLAYPKTKKINTNLAELMGCVATLNYFREFFPSLKATLYCDNSGTCDLVKKGFANDPNFNVHVKKIISLKLSSDISGPFHRDRKETYAADSIAFVGEEYYADMRAMEVFLDDVHKITVMIEGSVDQAVEGPYQMIYLRYENYLKDSALRLGKRDLAVVAVVAAYISTVASHVGDTVNPNGFQSFERYLLKCSRGNARLSGMLAWYEPARYLIETARRPLQPTVAQRVATFEKNCDELVRLLKALPSEDGGGDASSGGDANTSGVEQSLRHVEHDNAKILNSKGELSEDNASSFEKLRKFYDNLYRGVSSLAEALDMQPPVMPEDGHTTRVTCGDDSASSLSGKESSTVEPVWGNEVTRAFYECLPDLRAFVPAALLGESESKGNEPAKEAVARIEELKKTIEAKMTLRQSNLKPERPDPSFLRTLDSSIKHNTAVIKKLKQITEEQREGLMDELRGINMSKFVTDAVVVICDAKIISSDLPAAVQICSFLHQRYPDFSSSLSQGLLKVFFPGKVAEGLETDRNSKAMKKRNTLKLLLELYCVGVIEDSGIFVNIIKDLASAEHMKDRDATLTNLSLLATFARQGRVFLGLPLSGPELTDELFKDLSITADQKKIIKEVLYGYYDTLAEVLQAEHASLRHVEHDNAKILNSKGEQSDDNASSYEKLRKSYDNLYRGVSSLAEALDMQPPVMPEDGHTTRVTSGDDSASSASGKESSTVEPMWDNEVTNATTDWPRKMRHLWCCRYF